MNSRPSSNKKCKLMSIANVKSLFHKCETLMVGGFACNGIPETLIRILVCSNISNLTLICNDLGLEGKYGIGKIVEERKCRKVVASFIGSNKRIQQMISNNELTVELIPQGTLAECIRAAGYGLGGVLTPTGIGTVAEEGKRKINIDGKDYLLEKPLYADIALIYASVADRMGNLVYNGTERNFNHVMACAAKTTIVQAGKIVEIGEIDPNHIETPGIFVDYILDGGAVSE